MDQKKYEARLIELGIELRPPSRAGPTAGMRRAIFPKHRACTKTDATTTQTLQDQCKCAKNYFYSQTHIMMRCDSCKIRRYIDFKFPKRT